MNPSFQIQRASDVTRDEICLELLDAKRLVILALCRQKTGPLTVVWPTALPRSSIEMPLVEVREWLTTLEREFTARLTEVACANGSR